MQVSSRGRERNGSRPDPRRDAAHDSVQIHAALRHGGRRAAAPDPAAGACLAAQPPGQAGARQLRRTTVDGPTGGAIHREHDCRLQYVARTVLIHRTVTCRLAGTRARSVLTKYSQCCVYSN